MHRMSECEGKEDVHRLSMLLRMELIASGGVFLSSREFIVYIVVGAVSCLLILM